MLSARLRTTAAAAALALGGVLLSAGAAQAVDTTIVVQSEDGVVFADEPLEASGTCTDGSTSAVVTVEVEGDVVAEDSVDVAPAGTWTSSLDVSKTQGGDTTVTVDCFVYADGDPVGTASTDVYIVALPDLDVIDVTVSPAKVRIGARLTITATCPAGTKVAAVAAGSEDADEPFLVDSVVPAANGAVKYTAVVPRSAKPGKAIALVACGVEDLEAAFGDPGTGGFPTAIGVGNFTVLAAAVAAPAPAAAVPTLPQTGSDNLPLAGLGIALVLVGAGAYRARRHTA